MRLDDTALTDGLESVPCNFCKKDNSRVLFNSGQFKIVKCNECGLVYVNPRLAKEESDKVYNQTYFKSPHPLTLGYEDYLSDINNITRTFKKRWCVIEKHLSAPGRVLDIGCAYGFLLKYLKGKGYETYGIEISQGAARYAKNEYGLNIMTKPLRACNFAGEYFDAITIWDVIEHLPDPIADIMEMHRILKRNGILSIITPDAGSLQARIWGSKWVEYLRPDEHIYFFTREILVKQLEKLAFKVVDSETAGKYVSMQFVVDRLKAYSKVLILLAERLLSAFRLTKKIFYCDPKDKIFVNFQKF